MLVSVRWKPGTCSKVSSVITTHLSIFPYLVKFIVSKIYDQEAVNLQTVGEQYNLSKNKSSIFPN